MKNRVLLLVLFLSIFASNCFPMRDITEISKPEATFYKGREWDYLERILIKYVDKSDSKTRKIKNYISAGFFAVPFVLLNYLVVKAGEFDDVLSFFSTEFFISIFSGVASFLTNEISGLIMHKKINDESIVNTLEKFLQKYNPEISNIDDTEINYKKLIPEELYSTFDSLYEAYTAYGKAYLEKNSKYILEAIIDKIKYEVKKRKYTEESKKERTEAIIASNSVDAAVVAGSIRSRR